MLHVGGFFHEDISPPHFFAKIVFTLPGDQLELAIVRCAVLAFAVLVVPLRSTFGGLAGSLVCGPVAVLAIDAYEGMMFNLASYKRGLPLDPRLTYHKRRAICIASSVGAIGRRRSFRRQRTS